MMKKIPIILLLNVFLNGILLAQPTQNIRGMVLDRVSSDLLEYQR